MAQVRLALLGCGSWARTHAHRFARRPEVQIVALCDVDPKITGEFCSAQLSGYEPAPQHFTDPATMYETAKPDAVCIVTPHTLHYDHAVQALEAGCHVFLEKPMVTDSKQAHALERLVHKSGKVFVVGYNTPCSGEFRYLRQLIRDQTLGRLELVTGWMAQNWRKYTRDTWRQRPELSGGGMAYDSGAHLLNSLVWSVESEVAEVFAFLDNLDTDVDINGSINIRFTNGVLATLAIGGNCPNDGSSMIYMFDRGRVDIDGWYADWINVYNEQGRVKYPPITAENHTPDDNFIDAILGREQPFTSVHNGVVQSELMDAIYESARTGQPARPKRTANAGKAKQLSTA